MCPYKPCTTTDLLFLLCNFNSPISFDNKAGDALISFAWITRLKKAVRTCLGCVFIIQRLLLPNGFWNLHIRKYYKHICFLRVADPHLGSIQQVVISFILCLCLQRKCITSSSSLRQTKTGYRFGSKLGQVALTQLLGTIFFENGVTKGILDW